MAFVVPDDSWAAVINEFLMSCNDDEVEADDRPLGLLDACRVLHASTFQVVTETAALEDGKQYILCPGVAEFEAVLRKHGLLVPGATVSSSSPSDDDNLSSSAGFSGRRSERDSLTSSDQLESLEELSYYFDGTGTLRHCASNQAVFEIMSDESRAGEIDEIVKAAIFHIQMDMLADLNFRQVHVPIDPRPDKPKEARSSVFLSSDWRSNDNLIIIINGGRGVQPGIWSRDLLIQEGLEMGSMLPVFRRAQTLGFAVAVLNPFTNNITIGNDLFPIRSNASPDEHTLYVWDNNISRAQAKNVYILAYSFGAKLVTTLIQNREEQVVRRLHGIVFAEGAYRIDPLSTSPLVGNFLKKKAINFKADSQVALGARILSAEEQLSCTCLSIGDLAVASSGSDRRSPSSSSSSLSRRSSSNKARTVSLSLETTFAFFVAARDRGCSATQFIVESKSATKSWLGHVRERIDSLKPRKHHRSQHSLSSSSSSTSSTSSSEGRRPPKNVRRGSDASNLRMSLLSSGRGGRVFATPVTLCRFYAAELVLALEHLHRVKVAYRDLKPENILLEESGHLRVTDFGLSKLNVVSDRGAQTLAGSAEYLAPEVYSMSKYGYAVDWWSLGVFIFEMITGVHPFLDDNREVMVKKIMTPGVMQQIMPPEMPSDAASLLFGLLTFNPQDRLGSRGGAEEIRAHPFFESISWDKLLRRELTPPWKPVVKDELDVGNFDAEFTSEPVIDSVCTHQSVIMSATFDDFTFDPTISSMRKRDTPHQE
ncbi:hypothetical protein PybrP1_003218 [[Pythium] brassicae (nom. inval.)]|nr:hypothetical protein PybrP1_003218 [[Pythium] brassicae (nom. inval.)]